MFNVFFAGKLNKFLKLAYCLISQNIDWHMSLYDAF